MFVGMLISIFITLPFIERFFIALYRMVCYRAAMTEPKNSFHPTSLSLPFIIVLWFIQVGAVVGRAN